MLRQLPIALLAALLAVSSMGAAETDPAEVPAASRTTVQLLDAGLTGADGTVERAGLGELRLLAKRDGTPWAGMDVVGGKVAGQRLGAWGRTTDDGAERSGDASIAAPQGTGVTAGVELLDYLVRAAGPQATSELSTVRGELGLAPLNLRVDNVGPAMKTSVDETSASTTSLALGAVELTLGDLLPPGLVSHLPLGLLIDLLDRLPISTPTIDELLVIVEELVTDLTAAVDADEALGTARDELLEIVSDVPEAATAADVLETAEATLTGATASLKDALAEREAARTALAEAEAALADALAAAELDDVVDGTTDAVNDTVDGTTDTVDDTTDQITDTTDDATGGATDGTTDTVSDTVDDTTDAVDDTTDAVSDTTDDATDTVDDTTDTVDDTIGGTVGGLGQTNPAPVTAAAATLSVEAAEQLVTDAQTRLDAAIQGVAAARSAVATAEETVGDATTALDAAIHEAAATVGGTAIDLSERVLELRGEVETLLDRVTSQSVALPDLSALLDELRSALTGVPVVSLGDVSLELALAADAAGATAEVVCTLDSISVFDQTLTEPTCGEAGDLLATVPDVVAELLAGLPIDELPIPRIAGLVISTETSDGVEDGTTWARARVTGLALEVPSVSLAGLADQLTTTLDGLLAEALSVTRSLELASLAPVTKNFSTASVASSLADLQAQLDGLPIGGQLAGLRTVGVDLTVGHLAAEVLHGATADGTLDLGSPYETAAPAPDPAPEGSDGDDGSGANQAPSLPATGGGLGLLPLALIGGALLLRRRTTSG